MAKRKLTPAEEWKAMKAIERQLERARKNYHSFPYKSDLKKFKSKPLKEQVNLLDAHLALKKRKLTEMQISMLQAAHAEIKHFVRLINAFEKYLHALFIYMLYQNGANLIEANETVRGFYEGKVTEKKLKAYIDRYVKKGKKRNPEKLTAKKKKKKTNKREAAKK